MAVTVFESPWDLDLVAEALQGVCRFDDFRRRLGISRQVLTVRLRKLVAEELLTRERYQGRPDRYEYRLTPKGEALRPVIAEMARWSERWMPPGDRTGAEVSARRYATITYRSPASGER